MEEHILEEAALLQEKLQQLGTKHLCAKSREPKACTVRPGCNWWGGRAGGRGRGGTQRKQQTSAPARRCVCMHRSELCAVRLESNPP